MAIDGAWTDEELALKRKYFPRIPWTKDGPVRRRFRTRSAQQGKSATAALEELADQAGFTATDRPAVEGDAEQCLDIFQRQDPRGNARLVIGRGLDVYWCDLALGEADDAGWQELIVRTETAENLIALAHAAGVLQFRRSSVDVDV